MGVLLSILSATLYPILTGNFGSPRDYLSSYGLYDIFLVWFYSVLVGLVGWLGMWVGRAIVNHQKKRWTALSGDDSPSEFLNILARNSLTTRLPKAKLKGDEETVYYFVKGLNSRQDRVWIVPAIILSQEPEDWEDLRRYTEAGDIRAIKTLAGRIHNTAMWAGEKEPIEVFQDNVIYNEAIVEGLVQCPTESHPARPPGQGKPEAPND